MIEELTNYYSENRILSTNFDCQFLSQCSCGNPNNLIKGKSAYIGKYYEDHSLPRILFVSLDMGSDDDFETNEKRTPIGVRQIEEQRNWKVLNPLWQWYETHYFALKIVEAMGLDYSEEDVNHIFAHTNSAKCCENKASHDMSKGELYNNCRTFCKGEIELLNPDIIVAQGDRAFEAVNYTFPEISKSVEFIGFNQIHERIKVYLINDHPVLFLRTIYPSWRNKRTLDQREKLYPFYLKAAKDFSDVYLSKYH